MIPSYALERGLPPEVIQAAARRTPGANGFFVDARTPPEAVARARRAFDDLGLPEVPETELRGA